MTSSLFSALSGLKANQSWIDVIGNNLANTNTPGFKSTSATFSDHFSRTLQFASAPGANRGGRNPLQIGLGVRLSSTSRDFSQGALTSTGRTFDVALQGNGFFAVNNGVANLFSRVGTFGLDASSFLVDQRTGYQVLNPTGAPIEIDTDSLLPPNATSVAKLAGNLPKVVTGPLQEVLTASGAFAQGFPATVTATNTGPFALPIGQTATLSVAVDGGAAQTASVTSLTGSVTAADVASAIDALDDVQASVNGSGAIVVTSDRTGSDVTLKINPGAGNDLAALAGLPTALVTGSQAAVTATTGLNELPGNELDYVAGDRIHVMGVDADGTPINTDFVFGAANDGTTVGDLTAFLDGLYAGATVDVDAAGKLVVTADTAGIASLQLSIQDDATATGSTDWADYAVSTTTEGTESDKVTTAIEVFDPAGVAHLVTLGFAREADGSWTMTPTIPVGEGVVLSAPITGITFDDDGSPAGFGSLDTTLSVRFTGQTASQSIALNIGMDDAFTGLTQFGGDGEVIVQEQDGYGTGELASLAVDVDGGVIGLYTNGESQVLGAIGVATFPNPDGLTHVGDNLYAQSLNSGDPSLGAGSFGSAGRVIGGSLENSNVDTAEQFVHLIEAQRGFQANARVITAQNEVLRDMVNLI